MLPNVVPVMGLWHTYKHALEVMFRIYLPLIFGRLFHTVLPGAMVPKKPKHVTLQCMCLYLLQAWPAVRTTCAAHARDKSASMHRHFQSLCTLVNLVIPMVNL
jgi:hypothetical protein